MPIKQRITGEAARADVKRKSKGRHPMLGIMTKHYAVWQTIVQDGNPRGGMTASQISQLTHLYHPQVMKDLCDAFLVIKVGRNDRGEVKYFADEKGRGAFIQEVSIEVELFEDENGRFFTKTVLVGSDNVAGKIVRSLGKRNIKMRVPMLEENRHTDVSDFDQPTLGDSAAAKRVVLLDAADLSRAGTCIIDG